jgi:hypothetical protein
VPSGVVISTVQLPRPSVPAMRPNETRSLATYGWPAVATRAWPVLSTTCTVSPTRKGFARGWWLKRLTSGTRTSTLPFARTVATPKVAVDLGSCTSACSASTS